jgi:hypothetical protein
VLKACCQENPDRAATVFVAPCTEVSTPGLQHGPVCLSTYCAKEKTMSYFANMKSGAAWA